MLRSFYAGISGLRNHQQSMDVIGNNIANVNTPGFKSSRVTFMDTLSQTLQGVQKTSNTLGGRDPVQIGSGMTVAAIDKDMGQGSAQATGRNMDLAIQGAGFFVVGSGANHYYTRAGATSVDNQNNLVTNTGDQVWGWIDTNQDGSIDATLDQQGWINLDRRGDGSITNALASATPSVAGPNKGDTSLGTITTSTQTVTDNWRVECTDATTGTFTITGAKSGQIGTVTVGNTFTNVGLGTFVINGGTPQKAALALNYGGGDTSVSPAVPDSVLNLLAKDNGAGGNALSVIFANRGTSQTLGVTMQGTQITVSLATDGLGKVTSTLSDIAAALNASTVTSPYVQADVTGAAAGRVGGFTTTGAATYTPSATSYDGTLGGTVTLANKTGGPVDLTAATVAAPVSLVWTCGGRTGNATWNGTDLTLTQRTNGVSTTTTVPGTLGGTLAADLELSLNLTPSADNTIGSSMTERFLQNGAGPNLGDYFSFSTTAPGGATIQSVSISKDGTVVGVFDNGTTEELARVGVATVANPEGLFSVGDGKFAESPTSGSGFPPVTAGTAGTGTIAAGFLEMSNVDLTREFTDMITTQRGFQANSKIITTSDEMLQDLLALKR